MNAKRVSNTSITIPLNLRPEIERRCREERRSMAGYLMWLAERDIQQHPAAEHIQAPVGSAGA